MKQIKVSEATKIQLDWLVAKCEGHATYRRHDFLVRRAKHTGYEANLPWHLSQQTNDPIIGDISTGLTRPLPDYTTDWFQMGPIIDREKISIRHWDNTPVIHAYMPTQGSDWSEGQTPLIAVARCYVTSKLGDTVEVPEEL